jgi:Tfp pilus assembly protein PilO
MPDLRHTRKNIKVAIAAMAGIDLLAAVVYFSPLVGSAETRHQEMNRLQAELTTKTRQVEPLRNLPQKVVLANQQVVDFYKRRFPSQDSQIITEFGKLAAANDVKIEQAKYPVKGSEATGLQLVEVQADLSGSYVSLARFINALERNETFFIINSVTLGSEQAGPIKLQMKLETYLKAGA